jgi:circadian clock protein KaiC
MLDGDSAEDSDQHVRSLVHGVVQLDQEGVGWGASRRRLRVLKMRGIDFRTGPMTLTSGAGDSKYSRA